MEDSPGALEKDCASPTFRPFAVSICQQGPEGRRAEAGLVGPVYQCGVETVRNRAEQGGISERLRMIPLKGGWRCRVKCQQNTENSAKGNLELVRQLRTACTLQQTKRSMMMYAVEADSSTRSCGPATLAYVFTGALGEEDAKAPALTLPLLVSPKAARGPSLRPTALMFSAQLHRSCILLPQT